MIDPPQGYLGNWNNLPSIDWTHGDAAAQETNEGDLHRGAFLQQALRENADRSLAGLKAIERRIGTTAQQRPLLDARLRAAQGAASGPARTVLDTIVAWDGNYDREDAGGTVDPGVAAFEALKEAVEDTLPPAAVTLLGQRGGSHPFDMGAAEAAGFHSLGTAGLVKAAGVGAAGAGGALRQRGPGRLARAAQALHGQCPGRGERAAAGVLRPRDVLAGGRARPVGATGRAAARRPRARRSPGGLLEGSRQGRLGGEVGERRGSAIPARARRNAVALAPAQQEPSRPRRGGGRGGARPRRPPRLPTQPPLTFAGA